MNKISQQHAVGAILICLLMIGISATTGFVVLEDTIEASDTSFKTTEYETQANPYSSWENYRNIYMNVTTGNTTPSDFQTLINVTFETGMQADFDDLRFLDIDNETELDFWLQEKVNSNYALVWVQLNQGITASNVTTCYMYYNNTGVGSASNMTNTWNYSEIWTSNNLDDYTANNHSVWDGYYTTNPIETDVTNYRAIASIAITYWNLELVPTKIYWGISHQPSVLNYQNSSIYLVGYPDSDDGADATHLINRLMVVKDSNIDSGTEDSAVFAENVSYLHIINADSTVGITNYRRSMDLTTSYWSSSKVNFPSNTSIYNTWEHRTTGNYVGHVRYNAGADAIEVIGNYSGRHDVSYEGSWMVLGSYAEDCFPSYYIGPEKEVEGDDSSSYSIKGLHNSRITFAGTAGTTVYCNASGDYNEWLEINMSINASDNVTEIRVFMDDFNDTSAYINASNITMYVSSDNSSYGEMGTFTDGGSNCSNHINATNWNAGTMGADPFAGAGLTNKNTSIFLIFKMTIPADSPTDEFYTSASDSCKIYIGHFT